MPMRNARLAAGLVLSCGLLATQPAKADENLWGYVYGSETLPKGGLEIYQWITQRHGKGAGDYTAYDYETELEYGVTDRFQVSGYVTFASHEIDGLEAFDLEDKDQGPRFNGLKSSLKYAFLSPYKDALGLAVYLEPGFKRYSGNSGDREDEIFLEVKGLAQKNFLDDALILAYNGTVEMARASEEEDGEKEYEAEIELEQSLGLSYRVAEHWYVGAEGLMRSLWPNGEKEAQASFLGANVHYGSTRWWFTFTWLPQIAGSPDDERSKSLDLSQHEKRELRLKIGYNL